MKNVFLLLMLCVSLFASAAGHGGYDPDVGKSPPSYSLSDVCPSFDVDALTCDENVNYCFEEGSRIAATCVGHAPPIVGKETYNFMNEAAPVPTAQTILRWQFKNYPANYYIVAQAFNIPTAEAQPIHGRDVDMCQPSK